MSSLTAAGLSRLLGEWNVGATPGYRELVRVSNIAEMIAPRCVFAFPRETAGWPPRSVSLSP